LAQAFTRLLEVMQRRPELRSLLGRDFFSMLRAVCRRSRGRTSCGIGTKVIFIDADGSVYPCPTHLRATFYCGHLASAGLADIVGQSAVMGMVRERYRVDSFPLCKGCLFRYWCAGDCRGEVLAVSGDISGPAPYCADLQRVLVEVLWMLAGDDPWVSRA
jgi:radical SAM protein with 4Fe4S-binding SPASM domain